MTIPAKQLLRGLVALVALVALLVLSAGSALAQDDPYGSTTTTTGPPAPQPSCRISLQAATAGTQVTATVTNVPPGATVRILFEGQEVASATAEVQAQAGGEPVLFGGLAVPVQTSTDTVLTFQVPDVPPGTYSIVAVGATFTVTCGSGGFEVLAAAVEQDGGGSLARTGVYAGVLVAVATALILAGRAAQAESKRRRRRASRSPGSRTRAEV